MYGKSLGVVLKKKKAFIFWFVGLYEKLLYSIIVCLTFQK